MQERKIIPARLCDREKDYRLLGLKQDRIEPWEDGLRTMGRRGEFEWWYFDSKLEDGSSLVIVFFTTPMVSTKEGFHPSCTLNLTRADGTAIKDEGKADISECSFSRGSCCARIKDNVFEGDLNHYTIRYRSEKVEADIELEGIANPWRPSTGHIYFGEKDYFAWLPSVPEGKVTATIRTLGKTEVLTGTGYHDHNWGNAPMMNMMHHWYWGRASVGDYQIISCYITAQEKYGYEHFPIFMLSRGRELIADDTRYLTFSQLDGKVDPVTGKHYHDTLVYDYNDGTIHYRITYRVASLLEQADMASGAKHNPAMSFALKQMKLSPSYDRFTGTVTLERYEGDAVAETEQGPAIWELMYFGLDQDV